MATLALLSLLTALHLHPAQAQQSVKLGEVFHSLLFPSHELLGKIQLTVSQNKNICQSFALEISGSD